MTRTRHTHFTFAVDRWAVSFLASLGVAACGGGVANDSMTTGTGDGGTEADSGTEADGGPKPKPDARPKPTPAACSGSKPAPGGGGFEECDDGTLHRPASASCDFEADDSGPSCFGCACYDGCTTDADCDGFHAGGPAICLCAGGDRPGRCVRAECGTDADCPGDMMCIPYASGCLDDCTDISGFACQTPDDACTNRAHCSDNEQCIRSGDSRECGGSICGIGRPFLVDGEPRRAEVEQRVDWALSPYGIDIDSLDDRQRRVIGEAWLEIARMEHASVAAFARFTMELMSLGAPPSLVIGSQQAALDEVEHARIAFGLASHYVGVDYGPTEIDIDGALGQVNARHAVHTAILEGCIGETVAALEAAEAAERAEDPRVARILERISDEERRHASLAWRFVKWAVQSGRVSADWLEACFDEALAEAPPPVPPDTDDALLLAHGHIPRSLSRKLRGEILEKVVRPAATALLAETDEDEELRAASMPA